MQLAVALIFSILSHAIATYDDKKVVTLSDLHEQLQDVITALDARILEAYVGVVKPR